MHSARRFRLLILLGLFWSSFVPASQAQDVPEPRWEALFDGKSLGGWKVTEFGGGGDVRVEDDLLLVDQGEELSGFNWTRPFPSMRYEIEVQALRRNGLDFFCGLTFPVREQYLTFVVGGWGGSTVGISSINGQDASKNETTSIRHFQDNRWHRIRVRVEESRIQAWIDEEKVVDFSTVGKTLGLRPGEIEQSVPLGISTFRTAASFRGMRVRELRKD